MKIQDYIGKEVRLFPGDTYYKYAKLLSWDKESGYVFEITSASENTSEKVGDIVFYNNTNNIVFRLPREGER
jgi:predicted phosphatase